MKRWVEAFNQNNFVGWWNRAKHIYIQLQRYGITVTKFHMSKYAV